MEKITKIILATILLFGTFTFAQADEKKVANKKEWETKSLTKAEFIKISEEKFNKIDTNKDGVLTPEERKAYWEANKNQRQPKANDKNVADKKNWETKSITKAEFLKKEEEKFAKMDTNKDGVLSPEERKAYWEAMKAKRTKS